VEIKLFILILVANGSPILAARLFGSHLAWPVDLGHRFRGRPLLGRSKTWRGIATSILATATAAWLLDLAVALGILVAAAAMAGDMLASFTKRRMGLQASDMAPGLDQVPESLLPLLVVRQLTGLDAPTIVIMVLAFIFVELALSRIGYALRLRKRPY